MSAFIDLTGHVFNRLTVLHRDKSRKPSAPIKWNCLCSCGNVKSIDGISLRRGVTVSCGCFNSEQASKLMYKHGCSRGSGAKLATYKIWTSMLQRCNNPKSHKFHRYGARGIAVCNEWHDFVCFLADMGERPQGLALDRKNNNGNYCKENCRWATQKEQAHNRANNRLITFSGQTKCISEWAMHVGLSVAALTNRLNVGWDIEKALSMPVAIRKKKV
jgi:hypothetical protein